MRGRSWGLAVLWAALCIVVAAAKPAAKSSPESVTIPLILQQAAPPPKPESKKDEPKSPQAILDETKSVALQTTEPAPEPAPILPPPPAPTLSPALPENPELFVTDIATLPQPKPAASAKTALAPEAKPTVPLPKAKPVLPPPGEMNPVDDFSPGTFREGQDGKPPSFRCFVRDVMAFYDRTHVRCYNKVQGKVYYFAVDTHQPVATTLVERAMSAMRSGKPVTISFAPGTDLNPPNCGAKDCRRLIDIEN